MYFCSLGVTCYSFYICGPPQVAPQHNNVHKKLSTKSNPVTRQERSGVSAGNILQYRVYVCVASTSADDIRCSLLRQESGLHREERIRSTSKFEYLLKPPSHLNRVADSALLAAAMASAPSARRTGKGSMCNQQFRRIDAMCSALHKAVMTELAAETLQKRVETKRVEIENKRRAAAITLSAATPMPGEETARPARENFADGRSNGDEDGSDAPESSAVGSGAAALKPPCACSSRPSGSAGSGTAGVVSRSGVLEDEVGTAHRCGNGSGKVDKAMGVGVEVGSSPTGGETHGCDTSSDHGGGSTVQAAAAAVVTGNGAGGPLSASAGASRGVAKASKKHNIVFLEDLLRMTTNPKGSLRSNAIVMPKTKRKSHGPRDTGDGRSNEKTSRKKPRKVAGAASGPFSGLSLCVVHLGSVTKNTIKTFARGVRDGGGRLSTYYTAGDTTHIVVDASLGATWDKLGDYFSGWDDFEDLGGGGRSRVPDAVPVVSREWMSECLRRSSVVALDAYRLTPPPPQSEATPTAAETKGRQQQQQQQGTGTAVSIPDAAWNDLTYSAAAAAATGKMRPAARGEKINDLAAPRERNQGGDVVEPATDGAAAKSSESMVEGGFGARNPDVGAKRHKFHCQMTGSGVHVRRSGVGRRKEIFVRGSTCATKENVFSVGHQRTLWRLSLSINILVVACANTVLHYWVKPSSLTLRALRAPASITAFPPGSAYSTRRPPICWSVWRSCARLAAETGASLGRGDSKMLPGRSRD